MTGTKNAVSVRFVKEEEEKRALHGTAVYQTASAIVRVKKEGPYLKVRIHRKLNGVEIIPETYLEGRNCMNFME